MSNKKSSNICREEIRQSIARKYNEKLNMLSNENKELNNKLIQACATIKAQSDKIQSLEEYIKSLEEIMQISNDDINFIKNEIERRRHDSKYEVEVQKHMKQLLGAMSILNK